MKFTFLLAVGLAFSLTAIQPLNAQKLGNFGSSKEKKLGPKSIRVPYTEVISYLGYADAGNEDEVKMGKKFYYIYVWVPAVAPEFGIRMMSPVGKTKVKDAIESEAYTDHADSEDFFDTYITLERSNIVKASDISTEKAKAADWVILSRNDDSREMPQNPSGRNYNSLLRHVSTPGNPAKALTAGLYRIGFTTFKIGEVKGTFLAQVAAPIKIPGIVMAKTIDELKALIQ